MRAHALVCVRALCGGEGPPPCMAIYALAPPGVSVVLESQTHLATQVDVDENEEVAMEFGIRYHAPPSSCTWPPLPLLSLSLLPPVLLLLAPAAAAASAAE